MLVHISMSCCRYLDDDDDRHLRSILIVLTTIYYDPSLALAAITTWYLEREIPSPGATLSTTEEPHDHSSGA